MVIAERDTAQLEQRDSTGGMLALLALAGAVVYLVTRKPKGGGGGGVVTGPATVRGEIRGISLSGGVPMAAPLIKGLSGALTISTAFSLTARDGEGNLVPWAAKVISGLWVGGGQRENPVPWDKYATEPRPILTPAQENANGLGAIVYSPVSDITHVAIPVDKDSKWWVATRVLVIKEEHWQTVNLLYARRNNLPFNRDVINDATLWRPIASTTDGPDAVEVRPGLVTGQVDRLTVAQSRWRRRRRKRFVHA